MDPSIVRVFDPVGPGGLLALAVLQLPSFSQPGPLARSAHSGNPRTVFRRFASVGMGQPQRRRAHQPGEHDDVQQLRGAATYPRALCGGGQDGRITRLSKSPAWSTSLRCSRKSRGGSPPGDTLSARPRKGLSAGAGGVG